MPGRQEANLLHQRVNASRPGGIPPLVEFETAGGAYAENAAPDPGNCPREYRGCSAGSGFLGVRAGARNAPAKDDEGPVTPQQYPRIITGADAGERGGWPE